VVGVVSESAANTTSLRPDTPVVAGGGDGQAAGLGVNALGGDRGYLNLGTAVVGGVYSSDYRIGTAWRTMGACDGEGYYFETSLRAGTFLVEWFARHICGTSPEGGTLLPELEAEAAAVPVGSNGLLALPYWGGAMTPYWDPLARGCWIGLSGSHRRGHLYRSLLEGIALEQALVTGLIEDATGVAVRNFTAIGGGATSDLWCQILADATGKSIKRSRTVEASSLGAAICAAVGSGLHSHAADAAAAMSDTVLRETQPSPDNSRKYADLLGIYRELYPSLRGTFARLAGRARG
jgi:xylulokinase